MTKEKDFDDVEKSYFVETFDKSMQEKPKRKVESNMLADDGPDSVLFPPPPPKRQATNPTLL